MRAALIFTLLVASAAGAQVPQRLGYQGLLLRSDGTPETGAVPIRFSIWTAATAGVELWSETQTVALTEGFYATQLGAVTPLPAGLFPGAERFLELSVGGAALTPRLAMSSMPYALTAGGVVGGPVDATSVRVNGVEVFSTGGRLVGGLTATNGLTVANGSVALPTCAAGEVLRYDTGAARWSCAQAPQPFTIAAPLVNTGTAAAPVYGVATANGAQAGALSVADYLRLNPTGCATGQVAKWSGAGWTCGTDLNTGTITNLGVTAPLSLSGTASTPIIGLPTATASQAGALAPADFTAFSGKQAALSVSCPAGQFLTGLTPTGAATCSPGPLTVQGASTSWVSITANTRAIIAQASITVPGPGILYAQGTGTCFVPAAAAATSFSANVSTSSTASCGGFCIIGAACPKAWCSFQLVPPNTSTYATLAAQNAVSVPAGTFTFYLNLEPGTPAPTSCQGAVTLHYQPN